MDVIVNDLGEEGEAEIASWLVEDGSSVQAGQPIVDLETGKATIEVAAPASGKLEILVQAHQVIEPGAIIGRVQ